MQCWERVWVKETGSGRLQVRGRAGRGRVGATRVGTRAGPGLLGSRGCRENPLPGSATALSMLPPWSGRAEPQWAQCSNRGGLGLHNVRRARTLARMLRGRTRCACHAQSGQRRQGCKATQRYDAVRPALKQRVEFTAQQQDVATASGGSRMATCRVGEQRMLRRAQTRPSGCGQRTSFAHAPRHRT